MIDIVFEGSTFNNITTAGFDSVLLIGHNLDIGPINCDICGDERKQVLMDLEHFAEGTGPADSFFKEQKAALEQLRRSAESGEAIRIWRSSEPNSLCAFAFVCNLLVDVDCKIHIVHTPDNINCWGTIYAKKYAEYIPSAFLLDNAEKKKYSNLWIKLKKENAPLRVVLNGELVSADEEFYDDIIKRNIPEGEFSQYSVFENIFNKEGWCTHVGWFTQRFNLICKHLK